jgi:hypothetical protein
MTERERAWQPEDLARLFVQRANERDASGLADRPADNTGGRVQVARRQPNGSWLRIMDRPETPR